MPRGPSVAQKTKESQKTHKARKAWGAQELRKAREGSAFGKLEERLRSLSWVSGGWARKVCGWFSR